MNLIEKYQAIHQPKQTVNNSFSDIGFEIGKYQNDTASSVQLGSAQSYAVGKITVQQSIRAKYLKMLFSMCPAANQAAEKIVSCVLHNGWYIRPKTSNKKHNEKRIEDITEDLERMKLTDMLKKMLWSYLMYGDSFVYTPKGSGKYKDIARDLVALDNLFVFIDVNKDKYEKYGVVSKDKYKYEIYPIEGSITSATKKIVEYTPDEIITWSRATSYNPVFGTAPLEEDQATLTLGIRILNHNLRFFSNSAKPPLVINLAQGTDLNRAMEYKKVLDEKYKGANNMWETMVTWNDTKVQELTLPDTTAFFDFLTYVRIQVCGLLNVPPSELGITDKSGLNNAETAHKDFIKTNINAKKKELSRLITRELLQERMGIDDYYLYIPDMDSLSDKQRVETNRVAIESGQMTINEARESMTQDLINDKWAKQFYYGNMKGAIKITPLDNDILKNSSDMSSLEPKESKGNGRDGMSNGGMKPKDGGRGDLDGRDKEPNNSINSDDTQ